MLQWDKISQDEWDSIIPSRKPSRWDALLVEIERGSIIKLPVDDLSQKRGFRIGISRAAHSHGYKVEFRENPGYLALRRGAELTDKPKRKSKTSSGTDTSGEAKRRGRPRKTQVQDEDSVVVVEEVFEPVDEERKSGRSRKSQPKEGE